MTECPELWELVAFFGQEPRLTDDDVPWPYNEATWRVERDGQALIVGITGSSGDVHIELGSSSENGVVLALHRIEQLAIVDDPDGRTLVAHFGEAVETEPVRLRIDPVIRLHWGLIAS